VKCKQNDRQKFTDALGYPVQDTVPQVQIMSYLEHISRYTTHHTVQENTHTFVYTPQLRAILETNKSVLNHNHTLPTVKN